MRLIVAAVGLLGITPASGWAQTVYQDVEYVRGRESLPDKIKGQLVINDSSIVFARKNGEEVISIPVDQIRAVSNSYQTDPGSFGRKLLFGIFASRNEEYLFLTAETPERAEVLIFKTKKNLSPEMVVKIGRSMKSPSHGTAMPVDTARQDSTAKS
jgi:hypothetical protein